MACTVTFTGRVYPVDDMALEPAQKAEYDIGLEAEQFDAEFMRHLIYDVDPSTVDEGSTVPDFIQEQLERYGPATFSSVINHRSYNRWFGSFFEVIVGSIIDAPFMLGSTYELQNRDDLDGIRNNFLSLLKVADMLMVLESLIRDCGLTFTYIGYHGQTATESVQMFIDSEINPKPHYIKMAGREIIRMLGKYAAATPHVV